ncbi:MAG: hypothetical protein WCN98_20150 [Verrucomicrobiaceae bacterium]
MPTAVAENHILDSIKISELKAFWEEDGDAILAYGKVRCRISTGVGGNTYRAYGKFLRKVKPGTKAKQRPSKIFSGWVNGGSFANLMAETLPYADFHQRALSSLQVHWLCTARKKLTVYPYAAKLVDLHVKHVTWHPNVTMTDKRRAALLREQYQPLDAYSLAMLRAFGVRSPTGSIIRANARMGSIKTENDYHYFQRAIANICRMASVPNFAFDQFAWNLRDIDEDGEVD